MPDPKTYKQQFESKHPSSPYLRSWRMFSDDISIMMCACFTYSVVVVFLSVVAAFQDSPPNLKKKSLPRIQQYNKLLWEWQTRPYVSRFSNLDAVFTEIRIFPCYQIHFNPTVCMPTAWFAAHSHGRYRQAFWMIPDRASWRGEQLGMSLAHYWISKIAVLFSSACLMSDHPSFSSQSTCFQVTPSINL